MMQHLRKIYENCKIQGKYRILIKSKRCQKWITKLSESPSSQTVNYQNRHHHKSIKLTPIINAHHK